MMSHPSELPDHSPRNLSQSPSHEASTSGGDLGLFSFVAPLSPPPTVPLGTLDLPQADLELPAFPDTFASPVGLPSDGDDEAFASGHLEHSMDDGESHSSLSQERQARVLEPLHVPWECGSRSDTLYTSPTMYSPVSVENRAGFDWGSDSTHYWESPASTLLQDDDFSPSSSRRKVSLLDLRRDTDPLSTSNLRSLDEASTPSSTRQWFSSEPENTPWEPPPHEDIEMEPPSSPHSGLLQLPPISSGPDSDESFDDTVMPSDFSSSIPPSSPSRRPYQSLPDFDSDEPYRDLSFLTPVPRSPRTPYAHLPEIDMVDSHEAPSSPHTPHRDLPLFGEEDEIYAPQPLETISPSLLTASPHNNTGLGLFVQPSSIDPPLARSPSPTDDDFSFLDIQLDPESSSLDQDEFLALRQLRRRILEGEKEARHLETQWSERVSTAANALLPSSLAEAGVLDDPIEKRNRKYELHHAMDLRADARRTRKLEKQRSKEIGALMQLKMDRDYSMGYDGSRWEPVRRLVANMLMRRRDTTRALSNRKSASTHRIYFHSPLSSTASLEDVLDDLHLEEGGWMETE